MRIMHNCYSTNGPLLETQATLISQRSLQSVPSLISQSSSHLYSIHHHCLATLKGHSSYISSLALAGEFLYTGSFDNEIRSWKASPFEPGLDHTTGNVVAVGKGAVKSILVSADKIFTAHQDHKIRVWKMSNNEDGEHKCSHIATLPTLGDRAVKLLLPKNHVQVRRHKKSTWVHHVDTVSALALSADHSLLYSVSWDRTFKVWRTADFKCLESVANAHDDAINAVAVSKDGHVYTGSADKKIKKWNKSAGEKQHSLVATLEKHRSGVNALALSADGSVLYSGACDRSILVWETDEDGDSDMMMLMGALRGHSKSILCLAIVFDLLCSGSEDKTVRIWRATPRNYSCLAVLEGHSGPVKCLTAQLHHSHTSSTSYLVYTASLDCDIKVWHISASLL